MTIRSQVAQFSYINSLHDTILTLDTKSHQKRKGHLCRCCVWGNVGVDVDSKKSCSFTKMCQFDESASTARVISLKDGGTHGIPIIKLKISQNAFC